MSESRWRSPAQLRHSPKVAIFVKGIYLNRYMGVATFTFQVVFISMTFISWNFFKNSTGVPSFWINYSPEIIHRKSIKKSPSHIIEYDNSFRSWGWNLWKIQSDFPWLEDRQSPGLVWFKTASSEFWKKSHEEIVWGFPKMVVLNNHGITI